MPDGLLFFRAHGEAPKCPGCGAALSAWVPRDQHVQPPTPGDVTICGYCGMILILRPDWTCGEASDADLTNNLTPADRELLLAKQREIRQ